MLKLKKPVKAQNKNRVRPAGRTLPKATDDSDMYNREFPSGNFLFFVFLHYLFVQAAIAFLFCNSPVFETTGATA